MIFKISLRPIQLSDIGTECPFFPEDGDYERCFNALVQDMKLIDGITSVMAAGASEVTVSVEELDLNGLKIALKPLLQHSFQYLRLSELTEVENSPE